MKNLALIVLSVAGVATAQFGFTIPVPPPVAAPAFHICETSQASPARRDIDSVINTVREMGDVPCMQMNAHGSLCTTLAQEGSAAIGICGGQDRRYSFLNCTTIAQYMEFVNGNCSEDNRAGGQMFIRGSKQVILFNSADAS